MALGPRIVVILALAGAAYVILTNPNAPGPQLATVPEIVGLSEADAIAKSRRPASTRHVKEGAQLSADVAEGVVVRQDPQKSGKLEEGKTIGYWVSSGAAADRRAERRGNGPGEGGR